MNNHRYQTSRDYHALWKLLQETPVVCIVDYKLFGSDGVSRDICSTKWFFNTATLGCRGVTYVYATDEEEFVAQCVSVNLDWLCPPSHGADDNGSATKTVT